MPEDFKPATLYTKKASIPAEFDKIICISLGYLFEGAKKIISFEVKNIEEDHENLLPEAFVKIIKHLQKNRKLFCQV